MTIEQEIKHHMARAFFASAWSDLQESKDIDDETYVNLSGCDIMDVMPEDIDPAALAAANKLCYDMQESNKIGNVAPSITQLYAWLCDDCEGEGDRPHTFEMFGHYAAMQAMGHGVGLDDAFGNRARALIIVPHAEFSYYNLTKEY